MNYFQTIRDFAILLALLVVPALFLRANLRDPSQLSWLDRALIRVSFPVQYVAEWAADGVSSVIEEYVYLVDVKADNDHLRAGKRSTASRDADASSGRAAHRTARGASRPARARRRRRPARRVSSRRTSRLRFESYGWRSTRARRRAFVQACRWSPTRALSVRFDGCPTASPTFCSRSTRRAGSTSSSERVARVAGSKGLGERGRYLCRIQFDRSEDQVNVGDEVYTSGLGKKFPPNILIGYVSKITDQEFGLHQEGEVTPAVDFTRLDEVLILTSGPKGAEGR